MGEKPDEIKQQIDETRENVNENFSELQENSKASLTGMPSSTNVP